MSGQQRSVGGAGAGGGAGTGTAGGGGGGVATSGLAGTNKQAHNSSQPLGVAPGGRGPTGNQASARDKRLQGLVQAARAQVAQPEPRKAAGGAAGAKPGTRVRHWGA